jgi:hypothetical protein
MAGYVRDENGNVLKTARGLSAAALERRYRELLPHIVEPFQRAANLPEGTRYIGIRQPQKPLSLMPSRELKRGRPKKPRTP